MGEGEPGAEGGRRQAWGSGHNGRGAVPQHPSKNSRAGLETAARFSDSPVTTRQVHGDEPDPRSAQGLKSTGQGLYKQGAWHRHSCKVAQLGSKDESLS